jgi:hypothetical protein
VTPAFLERVREVVAANGVSDGIVSGYAHGTFHQAQVFEGDRRAWPPTVAKLVGVVRLGAAESRPDEALQLTRRPFSHVVFTFEFASSGVVD